MTLEESFFKQIEEKTGFKIEDGKYGFIMGTSTPYTPVQSYQLSDRFYEFIVWRKQDETTLETKIVSTTFEENLEKVIKFLNMKIETPKHDEILIT